MGLPMYIRNARLKLLVATGLLGAMLALPGEAKTMGIDAPAQVREPSAFGLFLDPHTAPELHLQVPTHLDGR